MAVYESRWYQVRRRNEAFQALTGTGRYRPGNKRDMEYAGDACEGCRRGCDECYP